MEKDNIKKIIHAMYIMHSAGFLFKELTKEPVFVFVDARTSLDFMEFVDTYLVRNGKS